MKINKNYQVSLFVVLCLLINYCGKYFAAALSLPLWLDSFGTVWSAYVLGPLNGATVGFFTNIIYGFDDSMSYVYSIANIAVGVTVGILSKKGMLKSIFRAFTLAVIVTAVAVVISTPLNCIFYEGMCGNIWGDGVTAMLMEWNWPLIPAAIVGEFYIDFLDKLLTLLLLFAFVRIGQNIDKKKAAKAAASIVTVAILAGSLLPITAKAENNYSSHFYGNQKNYDNYIQTIYNNTNGIPGGEANAVAATKDGILWVGTYAGLYRYNGTDFKQMMTNTVKNVNCLYVDVEGRLWVGTNDDGLSICINDEFTNVINEDTGLPSNSVRSIVQESDGSYLIGTSDSLVGVRLSSGINIEFKVDEINYATELVADNENHVAAVTAAEELFLLKGDTVVDKIKKAPNGSGFTSCMFHEDGRLFAATENHVYIYSIFNDTLRLITEVECEGISTINALGEVDGSIFLCGDKGIGYIDYSNIYVPVYSGVFNNSVDNMAVDYQNNLWFASSRLGLLRMSESVFSEVHTDHSLSTRVVNAVTEWKGDIFFGADDGLDLIHSNQEEKVGSELVELLQGVRVRCLYVDTKDDMWICTSGAGIYQVSPEQDIIHYGVEEGTLGNKFRSAIELNDGTMIFSGDSGITFIKDGQVIDTIDAGDGLTNVKVLCLEQKKDGSILAGTDGGGLAVINDGKVTQTISRKDGLSSGVILRIVEDRDDSFFVVTSNSLCYIDKNMNISVLTNFPYSNNYEIIKNQNNELFVLGSAGIYVVNRDNLLENKHIEYELLNTKKGLRSAITANAWHYLDEDGALYLATDSGVSVINIYEYNTQSHSYRMMIKSILVDGVPHAMNKTDGVTISKGANRIEITPEVINYSTNNPYVSYYLEGFEQEQTTLLQSELTNIAYTNLPSGDYAFHLAIWSEDRSRIVEESIYPIHKEKEIYDNWWFMVYFFGEFILIVAWATWFITRTIIQRNINLQRRELELTREQVRLAKEQVKMVNESLLTIARTVDAKDTNTSLHSTRVSEYSVLIGQKLGMAEEEIENLRKAALLHDIGKISIPDSVLNKPDRLTDDEYAIMKSHVVAGHEILKDFSLVQNLSDGALYHHERYDGKGYVHGLKGEEIPLFARIIGIADSFDAMTANRVYRKKLDFDYVLGEIKKGRGTQFDPKLVDIFLQLIEEKAIDVESLYKEEA